MRMTMGLVLGALVTASVSSVDASPAAVFKPIIKSIDGWGAKAGSGVVPWGAGAPVISRKQFRAILRGTADLPAASERDTFEYATARIIDNQVNPTKLFQGDWYGSVDWGKRITPTEAMTRMTVRHFSSDGAGAGAGYFDHLVNQAIYYNHNRPATPPQLKQRQGWRVWKYRVPPPALTAQEWHLVQYLRKVFPRFVDLSKQVLESEDFVFAIQPWNQRKLINVIGNPGGGTQSADLAKICSRQAVKEELRGFERKATSLMNRSLSASRNELGKTVQSFTEGYARSLVDAYRDGLADAYGGLPKLMNSVYSKIAYEDGVTSVSIVDLCEHEVTVQFRPSKDVVIAVGEAEYVRIPDLFGLIERYARAGLGDQP